MEMKERVNFVFTVFIWEACFYVTVIPDGKAKTLRLIKTSMYTLIIR